MCVCTNVHESVYVCDCRTEPWLDAEDVAVTLEW